MTNRPYEASVAIWKGLRPVANGGWLTIQGGWLRLYDGKGRLVGQSPIAQVWVKQLLITFGAGTALWLAGQRFMVSPGSGNRPDVRTANLSNPGGAIGAEVVAHAAEFGGDLVMAIVDRGGNPGKPPKPASKPA